MRIIAFILLLHFSLNCAAQLPLIYHFESRQDSLFFQKNTDILPKNASDSASVAVILRGGILALHRQTYLEAAVDSVVFSDKTVGKKTDKQALVYLHLGKMYKWGTLRNGNVDAAFLAQIGFRERLLDGKPLLSSEIFDIEERLLTYAENNGYPFARVWLDSLTMKNGEISAALMMHTGSVFVIDSVRIEGTAKISLRFLENYLDFKKGAVFSRSKVLKISQRLAELPYLTDQLHCPVSENISRRVLSLPLYVGLPENDVVQIGTIINERIK